MASSSIKAMGKKMNTGSQAQNSGMSRLKNSSSVDSILHPKVKSRQALVIEKLTSTADFMDRGSRQINTGKLTMSVMKLIMGSVIRKFFWLYNCATSLGFCMAKSLSWAKLSIEVCSALAMTGILMGSRPGD